MNHISFTKCSLCSFLFYLSMFPLLLSGFISFGIEYPFYYALGSKQSWLYALIIETIITIFFVYKFDKKFANPSNDKYPTFFKVLLFNLVLFILLDCIFFYLSMLNVIECWHYQEVFYFMFSGLYAIAGVIINGVFLDYFRNSNDSCSEQKSDSTDGKEELKTIGDLREKEEYALKMKSKGISVEDISDITGLSAAEIEKL